MTLLVFTSVAMLATAEHAVPSQCGAYGNEDRSCAEVPRSGSALLQTSSASVTAPLVGRVLTLEAETTSLESRVSALQDSLGVTGGADLGGGEGDAATLQMHRKEPYARYALLLRSIAKSDTSTLKEDVASLETRAAAVKSSILTLENQVSGNAFTAKYSLLANTVKGAQKGTSLESRVEALEEETSEFRTKVTSLEQTVVGLQLKAQSA